ncbi:hypothetical protein HU200_012231 [Digitaria exilis]|uniref:DUF4220 domain-containing protein n=1 Tax=Digitaria exilis TaxID=1010633 RepID=A0A835FGL5_9POAL|nr:hypothetical protein HU200_012231 [Digitaria exilis]
MATWRSRSLQRKQGTRQVDGHMARMSGVISHQWAGEEPDMDANGGYMESLVATWNEWEIRMLVLTSLALQVFLLFFAGIRKRNVSAVLSLLLWLAYLLADSIAIYALGYLSQTRVPKGVDPHLFIKRTHPIQAFWAPFLLLHLGGQDTITAFSIEDNELWKRHLLSLLTQVVALAVYVFTKSHPGADILAPAVLMFMSGIVKYGERTWALKCASMNNLRSGMVTTPDPGPNYAKFMEEYRFTREAGLQAEIVIEQERRAAAAVTVGLVAEEESQSVPYTAVIADASRFFVIFKRLFPGHVPAAHTEQGYKIIEIELSLMYDTLHSKAAVIHTWYGRLLRCLTLLSTSTACLLFNVHKPSTSYNHIDVCITNIFRAKWSNLMAQHNLISFCLLDKPTVLTKVLSVLGLKGHLDSWLYIWHIDVSHELKTLVFSELKDKTASIVDAESYRKFSNHRGRWALQCKGYYKELGWSVEVEFDESILLWHIATDLCFHSDNDNDNAKIARHVKISRAISNYMLFLLVARPFMLTPGIGQIRFGDTCAEAKNFFERAGKTTDARAAARMVLDVNAEIAPRDVKGDRSKSVLFDACRLAKSLLELQQPHKRWRVIRVVWVEMLCYAASKCRSNFHAKQLSGGGELLTVVWFLMAHLGVGEQYRIEAGHARAKLIVNPSRQMKKARTALAGTPGSETSSNSLIADLVLARDVADYIRFRAVCRPWRRCSLDPRLQCCLDGRYHPRQWVMLNKAHVGPRRRFLNVSSGECIRMDIPALEEHTLLSLTPEGLLLLFDEATLAVRLLNPLTQQVADLPPITALLTAELQRARRFGRRLGESISVSGVGVVSEASAVAVSFSSPMALVVAKPGNERWTLRYHGTGW